MADTENKSYSEMTNIEQLAEINNALYAIMRGGQSYRIGSRQLTRANLSELLAMQRAKQAEIDAETDSSLLDNTYVAFFEPR